MLNSKTYKGIIFRIYNSGYSDKILNILGFDGSKIAVIVKGIQKANSKRSHAVELGNLVLLKASLGYNIPIATEIKLEEEFSHLKKDLKGFTFLESACEIINNFVLEGEKDFKLFEIFYNLLSIDSAKKKVLLCSFIFNLLNQTGTLPDLSKCTFTMQNLNSEEVYINHHQLGFCTKIDGSENKVAPRVYKSIRFFLENSLMNSTKLSLDETEENAILNISMNWLEEVIGKKLKSKEMVFKFL